jgi:hypothetical protein
MRVAHPTSLVADNPPSLASQLLQWFCVDRKIHGQYITLWERGLLALRAAHPTSLVADNPPSLASQLLQWFCVDRKICGQHKILWEGGASNIFGG